MMNHNYIHVHAMYSEETEDLCWILQISSIRKNKSLNQIEYLYQVFKNSKKSKFHVFKVHVLLHYTLTDDKIMQI